MANHLSKSVEIVNCEVAFILDLKHVDFFLSFFLAHRLNLF